MSTNLETDCMGLPDAYIKSESVDHLLDQHYRDGLMDSDIGVHTADIRRKRQPAPLQGLCRGAGRVSLAYHQVI